jgi:hypothetical protein
LSIEELDLGTPVSRWLAHAVRRLAGRRSLRFSYVLDDPLSIASLGLHDKEAHKRVVFVPAPHLMGEGYT